MQKNAKFTDEHVINFTTLDLFFLLLLDSSLLISFITFVALIFVHSLILSLSKVFVLYLTLLVLILPPFVVISISMIILISTKLIPTLLILTLSLAIIYF